MSEPRIAFITYTKGAEQFVTSPYWESLFLDWLNADGRSSVGYVREAISRVGVRCCPTVVHATEKKEGIVLKLVKDESN